MMPTIMPKSPRADPKISMMSICTRKPLTIDAKYHKNSTTNHTPSQTFSRLVHPKWHTRCPPHPHKSCRARCNQSDAKKQTRCRVAPAAQIGKPHSDARCEHSVSCMDDLRPRKRGIRSSCTERAMNAGVSSRHLGIPVKTRAKIRGDHCGPRCTLCSDVVTVWGCV